MKQQWQGSGSGSSGACGCRGSAHRGSWPAAHIEQLCAVCWPLVQVLAQGMPAASACGVAQLWLEGTFLLAAVGGLGSEALQQAVARLRATLDSRLEAAVGAAVGAGGEDAAQLAAWAAGGGLAQQQHPGAAEAGATVEACRRRLAGLCEQAQAAARCNLAPLQQLAVPRR